MRIVACEPCATKLSMPRNASLLEVDSYSLYLVVGFDRKQDRAYKMM
jgi:hypothetical protein